MRGKASKGEVFFLGTRFRGKLGGWNMEFFGLDGMMGDEEMALLEFVVPPSFPAGGAKPPDSKILGKIEKYIYSCKPYQYDERVESFSKSLPLPLSPHKKKRHQVIKNRDKKHLMK